MSSQQHHATYVLVHGAWAGSWAWERVAERLRAHGHRVYTPTLSGLGERSHLQGCTIDLSTHISDVVNEITWKDLDNIVLLGHSYSGLVITGVAEEVGERISAIVFLDAFIVEDGHSFASDDTWLDPNVPMTPAFESQEGDYLREEDRVWANSKATAHPTASFFEKLHHTGAYERVPRKAFIQAMGWDSPFVETVAKLRAGSGWDIYEVSCGHDVAIDDPDELTRILERYAGTTNDQRPTTNREA